VGFWTKWCLDWRDPWVWAFMFVLEGKRWWSRPVLLAYWGLLAVISVAGWSRQLVRARRHRRYDPPSQPSRAERNAQIGSTVPAGDQPTAVVTGQGNASGFAQMMDAADQRLPTFSVNARRKFFHALAVVMFVPGLAVDVSYYTMTKLTT
jgi:dolichol kinase